MSEMMTQDIGKLTEALAKAKANFGPIIKNKTVSAGAFKYDYADLASIEEAITRPLCEQGLTIMQPLTNIEGNQRALITMLVHTSGQWIKSIIPLSQYNGKVQDAGKEITYLRRYSLSSLLGISAEDDTDGATNTVEDKKLKEAPKKFKLNKEELENLDDLIGDDKERRKNILAYINADSFENAFFTDASYGQLIAMIKKRNGKENVQK